MNNDDELDRNNYDLNDIIFLLRESQELGFLLNVWYLHIFISGRHAAFDNFF